jgi:hypothetical protein
MSGRTPWWRRWLESWLPFLFKTCPAGNKHWRWDHYCFCRQNEYTEGWHGGVLHFASGGEVNDALWSLRL